MAFQIEWIESRFFDPGKMSNEMIIIHHTGSKNGLINSFQGTIDWFKPAVWRNNYQVSAQYIIARVDRPIVQMVRDQDTAWHAGVSEWVINGILRKNLNNRSIGIELPGFGGDQKTLLEPQWCDGYPNRISRRKNNTYNPFFPKQSSTWRSQETLHQCPEDVLLQIRYCEFFDVSP